METGNDTSFFNVHYMYVCAMSTGFRSIPVERVEERHESLKKEKKELHDRNIDVSTRVAVPDRKQFNPYCRCIF